MAVTASGDRWRRHESRKGVGFNLHAAVFSSPTGACRRNAREERLGMGRRTNIREGRYGFQTRRYRDRATRTDVDTITVIRHTAVAARPPRVHAALEITAVVA